MESLNKYFKPTRNEIYERYQFFSCDQGSNESLDQWVTRLRQLSSTCNFGTHCDRIIRDRLVLGSQDKPAITRLFREKEVDLNKVIDQLRASELAKQQLKEIGHGIKDQIQYTDKGKDKERKKETTSDRPTGERKDCKFCNQSHIWGRSRCPAYGKVQSPRKKITFRAA